MFCIILQCFALICIGLRNLVDTDFKLNPFLSPQFQAYVKSRGYHLLTVKQYGKVLENAGFVNVQADDVTDNFVGVLKRELGEFTAKKKAIIDEFSQKDFDYIVDGWNDKVKRCSQGDQVWGYFVAKKPYA